MYVSDGADDDDGSSWIGASVDDTSDCLLLRLCSLRSFFSFLSFLFGLSFFSLFSFFDPLFSFFDSLLSFFSAFSFLRCSFSLWLRLRFSGVVGSVSPLAVVLLTSSLVSTVSVTAVVLDVVCGGGVASASD